jgi:hypothetical protein
MTCSKQIPSECQVCFPSVKQWGCEAKPSQQKKCNCNIWLYGTRKVSFSLGTNRSFLTYRTTCRSSLYNSNLCDVSVCSQILDQCSGSDVFQWLQIACPHWKWNNNTSSWDQRLYPGISYPPRPDVLPKTGDVRSRPFHRGKQTESTELHIYSIWRGSENVHR